MMIPGHCPLFLTFLIASHPVFSQSVVIIAPSTGITHRGELMLAHESQFNRFQSGRYLNSFTFGTYGLRRKTSHSKLTSLHAEAATIHKAMAAVARFLARSRLSAAKLKPSQRWRQILLAIARAFPLTPRIKMPKFAFPGI